MRENEKNIRNADKIMGNSDIGKKMGKTAGWEPVYGSGRIRCIRFRKRSLA